MADMLVIGPGRNWLVTFTWITPSIAQIDENRSDANRLGFAVLPTTVRFLSTFLEDPTAVPAAVSATVAWQLGIDSATDLSGIDMASGDEITSRKSGPSIVAGRTSVGLKRWLYAQCWTGTERPSVLFDKATAWMLAHKVLLPGATTPERLSRNCGNGLGRVCYGCWRAALGQAQPSGLEKLLRVPDEARRSTLDHHADAPGW